MLPNILRGEPAELLPILRARCLYRPVGIHDGTPWMVFPYSYLLLPSTIAWHIFLLHASQQIYQDQIGNHPGLGKGAVSTYHDGIESIF